MFNQKVRPAQKTGGSTLCPLDRKYLVNDIDYNKLKELLKSGMKKAYKDAVFFSEKESEPIKTEYLITINIAKTISEHNPYVGFPYKVILECPTHHFISDCVPLFQRIKTDKKYKFHYERRDKHDTKRHGKIDIAVYKDGGGLYEDKVPFCAIEVKGFNPSKGEVTKDLIRNSEYFKVVDKAGSSRIEFACLLAFQSYDTWRETDIPKFIIKLENKYTNYINHLKKDVHKAFCPASVGNGLLGRLI